MNDEYGCCKAHGAWFSYQLDGYMWFSCDEYQTLVRFCPMCGKQGKAIETHPEWIEKQKEEDDYLRWKIKHDEEMRIKTEADAELFDDFMTTFLKSRP